MQQPIRRIVAKARLGQLVTAGFAALSMVSCSTAPVDGGGRAETQPPPKATLGLTTSVPSEDLVAALELENNVRVQGRLVDLSEGPAAEAGLLEGDVLLKLGENDLYSHDDISDFLSVSAPGDRVPVLFKREVEAGPRQAVVTLGSEQRAAESGPAIRWQFASLGQLPRALETARSQKKRIMVGLSGAET